MELESVQYGQTWTDLNEYFSKKVILSQTQPKHIKENLIIFSSSFIDAISRKVILIFMDKETLLKLAQPAATALLAFSIISVPFVAHASISSAISYGSLNIYHRNSCAN